MNKSIGEFIRDRRKVLDLTQRDLLQRITNKGFDYAITVISSWENDRTKPPMHDPNFVVALADALEVDASEMLEQTGFLGYDKIIKLDDLSPIEQQLIMNLRNGKIKKVLKQVIALSGDDD